LLTPRSATGCPTIKNAATSHFQLIARHWKCKNGIARSPGLKQKSSYDTQGTGQQSVPFFLPSPIMTIGHTPRFVFIMTLSELGSCSKLDLLIAETQGKCCVTRLKTRKPRKGELVMSMTKGSRTNTNRRGQAYSAHALRPETNVISAPASSYFKTSG